MKKLLIWCGLVLFALPGLNRPTPTYTITEDGKRIAEDLRALRAAMHDPSSFKIEQVLSTAENSLCITYSARNSFGALRIEYAVISAKSVATYGQPKFQGLWNHHCNGKTGTDITHIRNVL
jgi:hypothetical protein